jgi:hypothetical protein
VENKALLSWCREVRKKMEQFIWNAKNATNMCISGFHPLRYILLHATHWQ